MFIYCKIFTYITSNFFVFILFVVNYVAWPPSNSLANCRPAPMYFCNIHVFPNLNTSWKLKKLFIYFLDGSDIHTAPKYGSNPIRYVTLHFRHQRNAASLRFRNRTKITVLVCEYPVSRFSQRKAEFFRDYDFYITPDEVFFFFNLLPKGFC